MNNAPWKHSTKPKNLALLAGWTVVFLAGVIAYYPGLKGPFMLDDFGSIAALGKLGGVSDWATFKAFVFGGTAGPTGRPLALLSFLIDANNWPTDPLPFKRTNLVIHLINGALLGVLTGKILRLLEFESRNAKWIALFATLCWVLHPFLVSTTLYVVQRMAQLSALFVFAGLITYLYGRSLIAANAIKAYLIMSLSVGLFTLLAMLSKENGILLPLLIGVLEITVLASQRQQPGNLNRYWAAVFIVMPSMVIAIYLGATVISDDFFNVVPPRDFSLYERLLTQPRILFDYLQHWFVPKLYTTGVFQDHFIKSTGILSPVTTALSALLHIAIISLSIINRRKRPLLAFTVLFFYASHVLESSVLNLELYFEHRNYLAAAFLFLPLVVWLQANVSRRLFLAAALGTTLVLGGFTRYSATIWQAFPSMVEASARKAPTSARAQAQYAIVLFNAGRYEESLQVIDQAIQTIPNDNPLLLVNRLIILCNLGFLEGKEFDKVATAVSAKFYDVRAIKLYTSLITSIADQRCPNVSTSALRPLFVNMLEVQLNADPHSVAYSHLKYFVGIVDVHLGAPSKAVAAFEESLQAEPGAAHAMLMAAVLATNDYLDEALYLSDLALAHFLQGLQGDSKGTPITENDILGFQELVRADLEASPN